MSFVVQRTLTHKTFSPLINNHRMIKLCRIHGWVIFEILEFQVITQRSYLLFWIRFAKEFYHTFDRCREVLKEIKLEKYFLCFRRITWLQWENDKVMRLAYYNVHVNVAKWYGFLAYVWDSQCRIFRVRSTYVQNYVYHEHWWKIKYRELRV